MGKNYSDVSQVYMYFQSQIGQISAAFACKKKISRKKRLRIENRRPVMEDRPKVSKQ